MKFKKILFKNGDLSFEDNPVTKFNSEENIKQGYVLHTRQKRFYDDFYITYACEATGDEMDGEYTILTEEEAKKVLKAYILKHKNIDQKELNDYYNEMIIDLGVF